MKLTNSRTSNQPWYLWRSGVTIVVDHLCGECSANLSVVFLLSKAFLYVERNNVNESFYVLKLLKKTNENSKAKIGLRNVNSINCILSSSSLCKFSIRTLLFFFCFEVIHLIGCFLFYFSHISKLSINDTDLDTVMCSSANKAHPCFYRPLLTYMDLICG